MFDARAELLDVYRSTPTTLRALIRDLPDEVVRAGGEVEAEDEWSIVEIVCHLRDAEERALARVRRMLAEDHPALEPYDQAEVARASNYRAQSLEDALEAFTRLRAEHVSVLQALDDAGWQRSGHHAEVGDITVEQLTAHMAAHDAVHLAQIARRILPATAGATSA